MSLTAIIIIAIVLGLISFRLAMLFVMICILAAMMGCGPSCEERGGVQRYSHNQLTLIPNGRGGSTQIWTPIYVCDLPEEQ